MTNQIYKSAAKQWAETPSRAASVSITDTAKLIRALLKKKFPNVKFSVRTSKYAGGSSMRISWEDGPTAALVEAYTNGFKSGGFDGMIDMKYSADSWLYPDGTASFKDTDGTGGQRGSVPDDTAEPMKDGAIPVRFGGDFIFVERSVSMRAMQRTMQAYAAKYKGTEMANAIAAGDIECVENERWGGWMLTGNPDQYRNEPASGGQYGGDIALRQMAARRILPTAVPVAA
jgi:hypothetical protein